MRTNKLQIVSICLVFAMVFAGYEDVYQYAKLQQADMQKMNSLRHTRSRL